MAGIFDDIIKFNIIDSQEPKSKDLNPLQAYSIARIQADQLRHAVAALGAVSKGLHSETSASSVDLLKDYAGKKESALEISFNDGKPGSDDKKIGVVEITQDNVDNLIKLVRDTTTQGNALKAEYLKKSGGKDMSNEDAAQVEVAMRKNLAASLNTINSPSKSK